MNIYERVRYDSYISVQLAFSKPMFMKELYTFPLAQSMPLFCVQPLKYSVPQQSLLCSYEILSSEDLHPKHGLFSALKRSGNWFQSRGRAPYPVELQRPSKEFRSEISIAN